MGYNKIPSKKMKKGVVVNDIMEDIIGNLPSRKSSCKSLFVISRNSIFSIRCKGLKISQFAKDSVQITSFNGVFEKEVIMSEFLQVLLVKNTN